MMSSEEMFDTVLESAMNDRRELIRFLGQFSDRQAQWEPPDGEWSIAQGIEHILLTDGYARGTLLKTLQEAEKLDRWNNAPENPQKLTSAQLRRREQGAVPSPDHLLPVKGRLLSEMVHALMPSREETAAALRPYRSRNLESLLPPSTRYGDLNIYDRMAYMGIHDALHHEQMERVTKAEGFPQAN
ncbi:MAG: DinB family protein [Nitrospinota bacterium]